MEGLSAAVAALDDSQRRRLVNEALARGETAEAIVHATQAGLRVVGERYEQQEIFLSGLIMAGRDIPWGHGRGASRLGEHPRRRRGLPAGCSWARSPATSTTWARTWPP